MTVIDKVAGNPAFYARSGRPRGCHSRWSNRAIVLFAATKFDVFTSSDLASCCRLSVKEVSAVLTTLRRGDEVVEVGRESGSGGGRLYRRA